MVRRWIAVAGVSFAACGGGPDRESGGIASLSGPTSGVEESGGTEGMSTGSASASASATGATSDDDPKLDVSFDSDSDTDPTDGPPGSCDVVDDMDAVGDCRMQAPA